MKCVVTAGTLLPLIELTILCAGCSPLFSGEAGRVGSGPWTAGREALPFPYPLGGEPQVPGRGEGAGVAPTPHPHPLSPKGRGGDIVQAGASSPLPPPADRPSPPPLPSPLEGEGKGGGPALASARELSLDGVVQEVLTRNPSLAEMTAAWQAASARYPQVTSLDDPMLAATFGPETIHPDDRGVEFASRLEVSQKFPWPGKRRLRGENALAEAGAAGNSVEDMRLQLIESAKDAFYEYFLVGRALSLNEETLERLRQFRSDAEARYRTPKERKISWQEVTQADVEIGRQEERRLTLERMRRVAVARINSLMHRAPDLALPPPPEEVGVAVPLPEPQALRAEALARRPDLQALANHIAAEEASLQLAYKEFYPDLEPYFMYDRFMGSNSANRDLATMLGVKLNLPVWQARRHGAVAEAEAGLAQRRAQFENLTDRINFQVQDAYERVRESERALKLYKEKILPDVELNVKTARSDYPPGLVPATSMIEAERSRLMLYDRYYEAIAEYHRCLARLERAIGGPLDAVGSVIRSQESGVRSQGLRNQTSAPVNTHP